MLKVSNNLTNWKFFNYSKTQVSNKKYRKRNPLNCLVNINKERLSYYNFNKSNSKTLLDTINFFDGVVSADTNPNGYFYFGNGVGTQAIPQSAVARINTATLPTLKAKGNTLSLKSNSYYSYKATDGKAYACAFNGKVIHRAFSESILGNDMKNVNKECRGNTVTTMSVISDLVQGSIYGLDRETVKKALANVGIMPGKFNISVDGQNKTYYMNDDGQIYTEKSAKDTVAMYNRNIWLKNQSAGDKIMVFGKEYTIGEDGHIHVPEENFWVNGKCNYGNSKK